MRFGRRREFDVPEIGANIENVDGVEEAFGFLVDFSDDAGADGFDLIAFKLALESELLALEELCGNADDSAIAADKEGLSHLLCDYTI